MTRKRRLLALLLTLALLAPIATAEDDDDDVDDVKRKVDIAAGGKKAEIKMSRESGGSEDEIKIEFDAGAFKVAYESENATTEIEHALKVRFTEAIEFRDANGNGAYDRSDTIVASHQVDALSWSVVGPDRVTSGAGTPGHRITGTGSFEQGGALVFVLYVYGDFTEVNGTSLRPSEVKIDIIFDAFPYSTEGTLPALLVTSKQESEIEIEGDDDSLTATANGIAAYFTWADNATVDGVDTRVHTTMLRESTSTESEAGESEVESKRVFALAYARGAFINHDPQIGIQSAGDAKSVPSLGLVGLILAGVAALALSRRR